MGLDIGFRVWDKTPEGRLVEHKLSEADYWNSGSCGRCEMNYAWNYGCKDDYEKKIYSSPVFSKEFDGYSQTEDDSVGNSWTNKYVYVDFEDFRKVINAKIEQVEKEHSDWSLRLLREQANMKHEIKEYRDLQLKCTEANAYAFDRFQEEINKLKEAIAYSEETYRNLDEEDYDYSKALACKRMLELMEKFIKEGYVVTTYYSD